MTTHIPRFLFSLEFLYPDVLGIAGGRDAKGRELRDEVPARLQPARGEEEHALHRFATALVLTIEELLNEARVVGKADDFGTHDAIPQRPRRWRRLNSELDPRAQRRERVVEILNKVPARHLEHVGATTERLRAVEGVQERVILGIALAARRIVLRIVKGYEFDLPRSARVFRRGAPEAPQGRARVFDDDDRQRRTAAGSCPLLQGSAVVFLAHSRAPTNGVRHPLGWAHSRRDEHALLYSTHRYRQATGLITVY